MSSLSQRQRPDFSSTLLVQTVLYEVECLTCIAFSLDFLRCQMGKIKENFEICYSLNVYQGSNAHNEIECPNKCRKKVKIVTLSLKDIKLNFCFSKV